MAKRLSREEIERRLLELERSPQPEDLKIGAMCYMPASPPDHWVYVCRACGRRTAYIGTPDAVGGRATSPPHEPADGERTVSSMSIWDSLLGLERALSLARKLPKRSGISLDESALCMFCRPDTDEYLPVLEVKLPHEAPRCLPLNLEDVRVLRAFLKESDRYRDHMDSERPLSDEVSRLRSLLLGVDPSQDEEAEG